MTQPQPDPRPGATLTAAQVDEIEQRAEAATPGPWGDYDDSVEIVSAPNHLGLMEAWVCRCTRGDWISPEQMAANQQFIAASRADVPALIASLRAAWRENERKDAALREAKEVLELSDPYGRRRRIEAPEDPEVRDLCERIGYGAVMDSASRQWRAKATREGGGSGAFTVGTCVGTVQSTLKLIRVALAAPGAGEVTGQKSLLRRRSSRFHANLRLGRRLEFRAERVCRGG